MVILVMTLNHFCSFSLHVNASTAHRYWMFTFATNIFKRFLQLFPHTTHFAHLSSISWSFLWAASTSMQEPSVSGRERERLEGCGKVIGCGKVKLWVAVQGCGGAGLACCEDRGGQLLAGGHSWGVLVFEFSEMSTSASSINLLLLALHPLRKKKKFTTLVFDCSMHWHMLDAFFYLLIINSPPVLPEASSLPAAVGQRQMCYNRSVANVYLIHDCIHYNPKPSATYLLESVALCRWPDVLGGPRSNSGRLVGPENEYMSGRRPTSLLVAADWWKVQAMKWFWRDTPVENYKRIWSGISVLTPIRWGDKGYFSVTYMTHKL